MKNLIKLILLFLLLSILTIKPTRQSTGLELLSLSDDIIIEHYTNWIWKVK